MTVQIVAAVALGGCLLWAAVDFAAVVAGLRAARWRAGGARRAVVSGLLGLGLPALLGATAVAATLWPVNPPRWFTDLFDDWFESLAIIAVGLAVLAQAALIWAASAAGRDGGGRP